MRMAGSLSPFLRAAADHGDAKCSPPKHTCSELAVTPPQTHKSIFEVGMLGPGTRSRSLALRSIQMTKGTDDQGKKSTVSQLIGMEIREVNEKKPSSMAQQSWQCRIKETDVNPSG